MKFKEDTIFSCIDVSTIDVVYQRKLGHTWFTAIRRCEVLDPYLWIESFSSRLCTDKRTENYSIKVPKVTKDHLDRVPVQYKSLLNNEILLAIARFMYKLDFNASPYLREDGGDVLVEEGDVFVDL
ncbi:MAG: hypothetical protein HQL61_18220 [Magnetococcales bacterium]|nr:hypothetical protein [Nitrospirota bacterium]